MHCAHVLRDLRFTAESGGAERFEVFGADAADGFRKEHGLNSERREIVSDAIALHPCVGIASRKTGQSRVLTRKLTPRGSAANWRCGPRAVIGAKAQQKSPTF